MIGLAQFSVGAESDQIKGRNERYSAERVMGKPREALLFEQAWNPADSKETSSNCKLPLHADHYTVQFLPFHKPSAACANPVPPRLKVLAQDSVQVS